MTRTLTLSLATLLATATACAVEDDGKGPLPDPVAGKADGEVDVIEHDDFAWASALAAELSGTNAHAWTFTVDEPMTARFTTSGDPEVDTVLYVHAGNDELAVDDDGGDGYFSSLSVQLGAGTYRVTVMGYSEDVRGAFTLSTACEGAAAACDDPGDPGDDPWALAKDVNLHHVEFTDATPIPDGWSAPEGISPVSLSSPEWWQRWSGGATQSFSWSQGTDYGKRCGVASGIRLQAIMEHRVGDEMPGRAAFDRLRAGSGWGGTMYNWTEDISQGGWPVFSPATIWAWRTGAIKWINVVHPDGSCDLPTLALVEAYVDTCLAQAGDDGEIQGCRLSADDL